MQTVCAYNAALHRLITAVEHSTVIYKKTLVDFKHDLPMGQLDVLYIMLHSNGDITDICFTLSDFPTTSEWWTLCQTPSSLCCQRSQWLVTSMRKREPVRLRVRKNEKSLTINIDSVMSLGKYITSHALGHINTQQSDTCQS